MVWMHAASSCHTLTPQRHSTKVARYVNSCRSSLGGIAFLAAGLALMFGAVEWTVALFIIGIPLWIGAKIVDLKTARVWYLSPTALVREWLSFRKFRKRLPWGHAAGLDNLHDIHRVRADGSVERSDGSYAALIAIEGRNTDRLTPEARERIVASLTDGIDEDIKDRWWSFYSTTRRASSEELAEQREHRAEATLDNSLTPEKRDLLDRSTNWLRERDEHHDANDWRHYVVVEATHEDIPTPPGSVGALADQFSGRLWNVLSLPSRIAQRKRDVQTASARGENSDSETQSDQASETQTDDEADDQYRLDDVLVDRIGDVETALAGVSGVSAHRASPTEHVEVLRSFWTDDATAGDLDEDSLLLQTFEDEDHAGTGTPTERMISPGFWTIADSTTLQHGEQGTYSRTYWISEWPTRPEALFLNDLYTLGNLDLDIKMHAEAMSEDAAMRALEELILDIDAEAMDRAKKSRVSALTIDDKLKAYIMAYKKLERSNAGAWRINGYVTVRSDSRQELEADCKQVRRALESNPAGAYPVASGTAQHELFQSCSPFGRDVYNETRGTERTHIALAGALGAMFPFGTVSINESSGMRFGRNTQTGELMMVDPWERGTAPHMTTIGWSGSGKTTFVKEAVSGWYLDGREEPRTLIVVDTQSEFGDLVQTCGGEHIPIGGGQELNPLQITAIPRNEREKMRERGEAIGDPLASKINEFTQFVGNLIRTESRAADGSTTVDIPYQLISYAAEQTYAEAGITHDDLDSHAKDSPTFEDFIDVLGTIRDEAESDGAHTFHATEGEISGRIEQIDTLLNNLLGFLEGGKYDHLLGEGHTGVLDESVRMAYLDCSAFHDTSDAEKSVGLQQAWSEVSQKVKQAPGKTMVVIDEAHVLYQSETMIEWLEDAAREWRRYGGCLWSVSQSPEEFVRQQTNATGNAENKRRVILEQCSTVQVFRVSDRTDPETLSEFGLDVPAISAAKNDLVPGEAGKDYTTCLVQFGDKHGWIECRVETLPMTLNTNGASLPGEGSETPTAAADGGERT